MCPTYHSIPLCPALVHSLSSSFSLCDSQPVKRLFKKKRKTLPNTSHTDEPARFYYYSLCHLPLRLELNFSSLKFSHGCVSQSFSHRKEVNFSLRKKKPLQTLVFSTRLSQKEQKRRRRRRRAETLESGVPQCFSFFLRHHVVLSNYYFLCYVKNKSVRMETRSQSPCFRPAEKKKKTEHNHWVL